MADDIVERLNAATPYGLDDYTVLADAAAEIKRLRAERDGGVWLSADAAWALSHLLDSIRADGDRQKAARRG